MPARMHHDQLIPALAAAGLMAALSTPTVAQGTYTSLGIDVMPDAISRDGHVVCGTILNSATTGIPDVFTWTAAGGFDVIAQASPATGTAQAAMSADAGVIARDLDSYGSVTAHRWTAMSGFLNLGQLPASTTCPRSEVSGISADGSVIVGDAFAACSPRGFRWDAVGGMVELSVLGRHGGASCVSGDGRIVGGWDAEPVRGKRLACVWYPDSRGQVLLLPGTLHNPEGVGEVTHINSDGSVIVGRSDDNNGRKFFRWTGAAGVEILDRGEPRGISEDGKIIVGVGYPDPSGTGTVPFIWIEGSSAMPLEQHLATQGLGLPPGGPITWLRGMTPDGRFIIGQRGTGLPREGFVIEMPDGIKYGISAAAANVLDLQGGGSSAIGQRFTATTSGLNGPFASTIITTGPASPLPFYGGAFLVDLAGPLLIGTVPSAGGSASLPIPLPNRPALAGSSLFMQSFAPDSTLALGLAFSNGLRVAIRN